MGLQHPDLILTESNRFLRLSVQPLVLQAFQYKSSIAFPRHVHDEYSLVVCLQGAVTSEQRGVKESLRPGDLVITSPGVLHASSYAEDGYPTTGLSISLSWTQMRSIWERSTARSARGAIPVFLGKQNWQGVEERARAIVLECREQRPGYVMIAEGLAHRLLFDVLSWWPAELVSLQSPDKVHALDRWQFVVAVEELGRSIQWKQSVDRLCREMDLAANEFRARFEDSVRMPLEQCNRDLVVHRLRNEMAHGTGKLGDLARESGFRSVNHLVGTVRATMKFGSKRLGSVVIPSTPGS